MHRQDGGVGVAIRAVERRRRHVVPAEPLHRDLVLRVIEVAVQSDREHLGAQELDRMADLEDPLGSTLSAGKDDSRRPRARGSWGTVLHWNGTVWSIVPTPTTDFLYAVFGNC